MKYRVTFFESHRYNRSILPILMTDRRAITPEIKILVTVHRKIS
jgi:hypothetical protein